MIIEIIIQTALIMLIEDIFDKILKKCLAQKTTKFTLSKRPNFQLGMWCDANLLSYDDQENLLQIVCHSIVFEASKILHDFGWTCAFYWPYGTKVELLLAKFVARAPCWDWSCDHDNLMCAINCQKKMKTRTKLGSKAALRGRLIMRFFTWVSTNHLY